MKMFGKISKIIIFFNKIQITIAFFLLNGAEFYWCAIAVLGNVKLEVL